MIKVRGFPLIFWGENDVKPKVIIMYFTSFFKTKSRQRPSRRTQCQMQFKRKSRYQQPSKWQTVKMRSLTISKSKQVQIVPRKRRRIFWFNDKIDAKNKSTCFSDWDIFKIFIKSLFCTNLRYISQTVW